MPDEREWIRNRVEGLTDGANNVKPAFQEGIDNSFNTWSALKLIVHSATVNMYTKVISDHMDDFFYVDTLAGSGLSEYGEGECFYGSPIVAAKHAAEPFTKMYFLESDSDKCELLRERLEYFFKTADETIQEPKDWVVWNGDANDLTQDVVSDIWDERTGRFNTLTFVDNQALDYHWNSILKMADLSGDFLVNYPGAMAVGMNINHRGAHSGKLKEFFGRDLWEENLNTRKDYKLEYINQIKTLFDDGSHYVPVKVDSGTKSYEYDLIYATRDTKRGSGYVDAIRYVRKFVENVDGGDVGDMIDLMHGDQSIIDMHLPQKEQIDQELLGNDEESRSESQSGLQDFE